MKKLMIYTDCSFFAGCENVLENILNTEEVVKNYDVVFCYRYSRRYEKELMARPIDVQTFPVKILTNDDLIIRLKDNFGKGLIYKICLLPFWLLERIYLYHLINFFLLRKLISKQNPDIIHINNGGYPGSESCRTMALSAISLRKNAILFTVNNMAIKSRDFIDRLIDSLINQNVSNFVTASKAASKRLSQERGFSRKKLEVIHNTVLNDASHKKYTPMLRSEFKIDRSHCVIGSLGLLIERKGYESLIEAARQIKSKNNWSIYIFGEGEERKKLEALINKYQLTENIHLPGFRPNPIDYLIDFDVFILPSIRNEDQPNVISEAMLFSKPIIGTYVAGIPEQIDDGKTGYLCEPGNISQIVNALNSMIDMSKERRLMMGSQSYEKYLNEFSYEKSMQKYLTLYNKISDI